MGRGTTDTHGPEHGSKVCLLALRTPGRLLFVTWINKVNSGLGWFDGHVDSSVSLRGYRLASATKLGFLYPNFELASVGSVKNSTSQTKYVT